MLSTTPQLAQPRCPLQVVLGTESGMITAIVRRVQSILRDSGRADVDCEIVFPVASEAITTQGRTFESLPPGSDTTFPEGLAVLPGVTQGEGCSAEGGCASCPYMKMNSLQCALQAFKAFQACPCHLLPEHSDACHSLAPRLLGRCVCLHGDSWRKRGSRRTCRWSSWPCHG